MEIKAQKTHQANSIWAGRKMYSLVSAASGDRLGSISKEYEEGPWTVRIYGGRNDQLKAKVTSAKKGERLVEAFYKIEKGKDACVWRVGR